MQLKVTKHISTIIYINVFDQAKPLQFNILLTSRIRTLNVLLINILIPIKTKKTTTKIFSKKQVFLPDQITIKKIFHYSNRAVCYYMQKNNHRQTLNTIAK